MKKATVWMLLAVVMFATTACATLFSDDETTVRFESEPSGATVRTHTGRVLGTTPFTQTLEADDDYQLFFTLDGYQEQVYDLDKTLNPVAILNLGNLLFWGIDFLTGSIWELDDEFVRVTLQEQTASLSGEERMRFACAAYKDLRLSTASGLVSTPSFERGQLLIEAETGVASSACTSGETSSE